MRNKVPSKYTDQSRRESPKKYKYIFKMEITLQKSTEVPSASQGLSPMTFRGESGTVTVKHM